MRLISPAKLEIQLRRLENRFADYCGEHLAWATPLAAAALVLISLWIKKFFEIEVVYQTSGMFQIVRQGRFAIPLLLAFSGVSVYLHGRNRAWFNAFVTLTVWLWSCYSLFLGRVPMDVYWVISVSFPCLALLTYFIGRARRQNFSRTNWVTGIVVIFALIWIFVGARLYGMGQYHMLVVFWRFKLQYMVLVAIQMAYVYSHRPIDPFSAFNPAGIPRATLWPVDTLLATKNREAIVRFWWKGFLGVLIGYLVIYLKITLDRADFDQSEHLWVRSTSRYFLVILADVGVLNIMTGIARIFGHRVRDATNFCWLARTPAEYWRRGSVFHYEFINRYLSPRMWRIFRNRFVVTFICFFFFYIMKNGVLDFSVWSLGIFGFDTQADIFRNATRNYSVTLFLLHFLLLFATQRHWFFEWENHRAVWKPWCSIFITYALQIGAIALSMVINRNL
jgi:hypothetical protein